jgi:hypothetical protein
VETTKRESPVSAEPAAKTTTKKSRSRIIITAIVALDQKLMIYDLYLQIYASHKSISMSTLRRVIIVES